MSAPWRGVDEAVAHGARWIDLEVVAASTVEKAVDRPHEPIVCAERLVPLHLVAQNALGLAVVEDDPKNHTVGVVDETHLGRFRRRRAVVRIALKKTGGDSRAFPHRFVEHTVEPDLVARSEPKGGHDSVRGRGGILGQTIERTQEKRQNARRAQASPPRGARHACSQMLRSCSQVLARQPFSCVCIRSVRLQPDAPTVRLPPSRAKRASASLAEAFGGGGKADTTALRKPLQGADCSYLTRWQW